MSNNMEEEKDRPYTDTPEYVKGMIYAQRMEDNSYRAISNKISSWGLPVGKSTIERHWN